MNDFIFITENVSERDKQIFFGPIVSTDVIIILSKEDRMSHVLVKAGVFKSISQAKANGFNVPIPVGFSDGRYGKKQIRVSIFNLTEELEKILDECEKEE